MASFLDMRPDRGSADAERRIAPSFRRLAVLLVALTAPSVVAFIAVSELATPGAKDVGARIQQWIVVHIPIAASGRQLVSQ